MLGRPERNQIKKRADLSFSEFLPSGLSLDCFQELSEAKMSQQPGEKRKGMQELTAWEYLSGAPLLFGGVAMTFASLGYGLYHMMRGDMSKQAKVRQCLRLPRSLLELAA